MTEMVPAELAPWTLVFEEVTNDPKRARSGVQEEHLDELRRLGFTSVGTTAFRLRDGDPARAVIEEVMAGPMRDVFAGSACSPDTGVCATELVTILDDGTVVATDDSRTDEATWRKFNVAIMAAACDGFELVFAPRGFGLGELAELHGERVRNRVAEGGAKPVSHESLDQYLELRRMLALLRAERRRFQWRVAGIVVKVSSVLVTLAAVMLVASVGLQVVPVALALLTLAVFVVLVPRLAELAEHRLGPRLFRLLRPKQKLRLRHADKLGPYR